jgi:hypothetical protein
VYKNPAGKRRRFNNRCRNCAGVELVLVIPVDKPAGGIAAAQPAERTDLDQKGTLIVLKNRLLAAMARYKKVVRGGLDVHKFSFVFRMAKASLSVTTVIGRNL